MNQFLWKYLEDVYVLYLGMWFNGGIVSAELGVGLDDLERCFPFLFYMIP